MCVAFFRELKAHQKAWTVTCIRSVDHLYLHVVELIQQLAGVIGAVECLACHIEEGGTVPLDVSLGSFTFTLQYSSCLVHPADAG